MDLHIHAHVAENGFHVGRNKCFTGESALDDAKSFLVAEMEDDQNLWARNMASEVGADITEGQFDNARLDLAAYDGHSGDWWREVKIPNDALGKIIPTNYCLMEIDGACEETLDD